MHSVKFRGAYFALAAAAGLVMAQGASAQYESGFEAPTYTGSPDGTVISGTDGWYLPPVGGQDGKVYTYTDNVLGLPANPTGGDQFEGGVSDGALFPRAQHDHDFSAGGIWVLGYDIAPTYSGNFPAAANLASFSLQDSTIQRFFISLNNFEDPNTCTTWKGEYNVYDVNGLALNNQSPGDAWKGLAASHWYRLTTTVNFDTNQVTHVTITDLSPDCAPDLNGDGTLDLFDFLAFTNLFNAQDPGADWNGDGVFDLFDFLGFVNSFNAGCAGSTAEADVDWYLTGGALPVLPLPTAIRCFVGGSAGDTAGYDNISIAQ